MRAINANLTGTALCALLGLSACGGSAGRSAVSAPDSATADLLPLAGVSRMAPLTGRVDGASRAQLQPGVGVALGRDGGALDIAFDSDSSLSRILPGGAREQLYGVAAGASASVPAPDTAGTAFYYEAAPDSGGNKVSLGLSDLEPGQLEQPVIFIRSAPDPNCGRGPLTAFRNFWRAEQALDQAIMRLDPDGTLSQVLAVTGRPMQDLEVSYDGSRILFAMQDLAGFDLEIFEMRADGGDLSQLTYNDYDDGEPCYLPDGRILFTSERLEIGDFYDGVTQVAQLYALDPFTGTEELVHLAADGVFSPMVARDGRIWFVSWDTRVNINGPFFNRFVVWRINPDGTEAFPIFGSHVARDNFDCYLDASETPDGKLLVTHTNFNIPGQGIAHQSNYGAGAIVEADPDSNQDFPNMRYLTDRRVVDSGAANTLGRYKFPVGLPNGDVLVTYAPGDVWDDKADSTEAAPDFGIYLLRNGETIKACDAEGLWEFGAVPLAPRTLPPVVPSRLQQQNWGEFACENIFDRGGDMRQGIPKPEDGPWKLRVIQALRTKGIPSGLPNDLFFPGVRFGPLADGKVIGEFPVAPDGSFRIRVPADMPLSWELVNGAGQVVVRERMYNTVRPGEQRSCAGCHARVDIKHNVDKHREAFKPQGAGYHDLRSMFADFYTTVVVNEPK